ncbi:MAG: DUF2156 domain-containing protein [Ruminococcaceae bacterium]|nr:DUF2156 domain-containing protein [Oscillospiraceae bacterium]
MLDFQDISIEDRERVENYFEFLEEPFCDFTFGNLFCWSVVENTKIAFLNNFLFIRFSDNEKLYYTFPLGNGEIKNAINLIIEDAKINNKKFQFVCLNKKQSEILKEIFKEEIKINKNRDAFDYVYSVKKLSTLSGRKYHSKKNHFNSFKNNYNFIYEEINENNLQDCIRFANEWYSETEATPPLLKEQKVLIKAFENYFKLNLIGAIIKINEKIVAFCVGEKMYKENIFCTHFEKASSEFQKAYTVINKLFSEISINNFEFVNREDDAGIEGLRKAKLSYYPELILEKYYAEF